MASNFSYLFDASSTEIVYDKKMREKWEEERKRKKEELVSESTAPLVPTTVMGRAEFRYPNPDEIILYFYPQSYYSQVVLLAMFQRQISFTAFVLNIHNGEQFREEFLRMNPRGEVPVLNDGISEKVITDAALILRHIESHLVEAHGPSLLPLEPAQRRRAEELAGKLHRLKVESLTFGSIVHQGLDIEPQGMFADENRREGIREYLRKRRAIYRTEILNYPEYADALNRKLVDIIKDWHFLEHREDYEELVQSFERVLDECEEEIASKLHHGGFLQSHRQHSHSHGDQDPHHFHHHHVHPVEHPDEFMDLEPSNSANQASQRPTKDWWLCSPEISIADIFLAIVIHRLTELGYEKRMLSERHHLANFYKRIQDLEAFQRATDPDFLYMKGTSVETESVLSTSEERIPYYRSRQKGFPWWIVALPLGTIIVYGFWGWIEGPPQPFVPNMIPLRSTNMLSSTARLPS